MEYNFLADWCVKRTEKREKRNFKIITYVCVCLCVIVSMKTIFDFKIMKNKKNVLNKKIENYSEKTNKEINRYKLKDTRTVKTLGYFVKNYVKILDYNTVEINSSNIKLEVSVQDEEEYINKIKIIESDKKYRIKEVSPFMKDNDKKYFKIEIEVI